MTYVKNPKFKKEEHCVRTKKIQLFNFIKKVSSSKFYARHFITRDETSDIEKFAKNS